MKTVWSIGGHDPNAVAGLAADLLTMHTLNIKARILLSCFTAQSDKNISFCEAIPLSWFAAQWQTLRQQERPRVLKLGLMITIEQLDFLAEQVAQDPELPVIFDPVLASSSGYNFASEEFLENLKRVILPRVDLLTPNIPEAERLLKWPIQSHEDIVRAAIELRSLGPKAVLIKGGHFGKTTAIYDYYDDGKRPFYLHGRRIDKDYRGTGCSLASAVSAELAKGLLMREAIVSAHAFLQNCIRESFAAGSPYLDYERRSFALPGLSYSLAEPALAFPKETKALGFYPIVPDLNWLLRLAELGISTIQLRIKNLGPSERKEAIFAASRYCEQRGIRLYVNDHWREALAAKAYGIHLGQEDLDLLSPEDLAQIQAAGLRLGISTHSYEEAARAQALRPSYIALGPIFPTSCKSMSFGPQGISRIGEWLSLCPDIPLVVIGGLCLQHVESLLTFPISGIAVISDVLAAADPLDRAQQWLLASKRLEINWDT